MSGEEAGEEQAGTGVSQAGGKILFSLNGIKYPLLAGGQQPNARRLSWRAMVSAPGK